MLLPLLFNILLINLSCPTQQNATQTAPNHAFEFSRGSYRVYLMNSTQSAGGRQQVALGSWINIINRLCTATVKVRQAHAHCFCLGISVLNRTLHTAKTLKT